MKPFIHAQSSVKKFGGKVDDYIEIHQWFDETKAHFPDNRHRALRHHTQGIFEAERIFGINIKNSDNKEVSVRDIGEQHVLEDLGFIPTVSDYLKNLNYQNWMHGKGLPESLNNELVKNLIQDKKVFTPINTPPFEEEHPFYDGSRIID